MKKLALILLLSLFVIKINSRPFRCRDDGDCEPGNYCSFDTGKYLASTETGECCRSD